MRAQVAKPAASVSWAHGPLQRKCSTCGASHAKAECPKCKQAATAAPESLEREADRVADQILKGASAGATGDAPSQIQRRANPSAPSTLRVPDSVGRALSEPGRALQPALRRDMEQRFAHDFSSVRIHTGATAERSARDVDAQAYTVGQHVVFDRGRFDPGRAEGRRLLAHELTHVVQQGRARPTGVLRYSPRGDQGAPAEREAERNAAKIDQGGRLNVTLRYSGTPMLNRAPNSPGGCGVCMKPMLAGTMVHALVGARNGIFNEEAGGAQGEMRISAPIPGAAGGRLDMAVVRPREQTIYVGELKPKGPSGAAGAKADLAFYFALLASHPTWGHYHGRLMKKGHFTPRPVFLRNPRMPGCPGQTVTITNPSDGVYLYECSPHATTLEATPACKCKKQKKKKKKKQQKKKTKQQKKQTPKKKTPKKKATKPKAPKKAKKPKTPKKKPPKTSPAKKPQAKPKPKSAGGAYNVGFGLSIFSIGGGAGNAGVGVSIFSTSTGFGTAGAGVSIFSDTIAAGAAGAGATVSSEGAAAGSAGAGASKDSMGAGAGTAGVGTAEGTTAAAAGAAGKGKVKDSELAGAGVAGSGEVEGSQVAGAGGTGSGKLQNVQGKGTGSTDKPVDAKDVQGDKGSGDAKGTPAPTAQPGTGKGGDKPAGSGDKSGTGTGKGTGSGQGGTGQQTQGKPGTGTQPGQGDKTGTGTQTGTGAGQGSADPAAKPGTGATGAGQQGQGTSPKSPGDLKSELADILGVLDPDSKPEDRAKAAEEATKINEMLKTATSAQKALLAQLAQRNGNDYRVPASDWVNKILEATKGITEDDLKYLATLEWRPGHITAEELRKRILKALENKNKPAGDAQGAGKTPGKDAPTGEAGKGQGQGSGSGAGKGAGAATKKDEGSAPPGEGSKGGAESGKYTVARPFKGETKDVYERDYQFVVVDNQITATTQKGAKPEMTLQWIGDDKKAYYYKLVYEVTDGPTEKKDDKKPNVTWLYFTLKSTNTELIDIAPEGQTPFLIKPGRPAWYRVQKK